MTRTVLHCYTIALAAVVVVAEFEWPALLRAVPFLEPWAVRGFFHILCAPAPSSAQSIEPL